MLSFCKRIKLPLIVVGVLGLLLLSILQYNKQGYCYKTGAKLGEKKLAAMVARALLKNSVTWSATSDYYKIKEGRSAQKNKKNHFFLKGGLSNDEIFSWAKDNNNFLESAILLLNKRMVDALGDNVVTEDFTEIEYSDSVVYGSDDNFITVHLYKGIVSKKNNKEMYEKIHRAESMGLLDRTLGFGNFFYGKNYFYMDKECCMKVAAKKAGNSGGVNQKNERLKNALGDNRFIAISNCGDIWIDPVTDSMLFAVVEN